MDGYESHIRELRELGADVVGACSDDLEDARKVAEDVSFPIGYGVTRDDADRLGGFWDEGGGFIQPTEFIVDGAGKVVASMYSSSPVGRIAPEHAVALLKMMRKKQSES